MAEFFNNIYEDTMLSEDVVEEISEILEQNSRRYSKPLTEEQEAAII